MTAWGAMQIRAACFLGLIGVLGLAPGCRHHPGGAAAPWLAMERQPPEEGAMGVLSAAGSGQREFTVYWTKARQGETLPGLEFLAWFRGPRAEKVMAVECLSLSMPLLAGEPSEHPAVFAEEQGRAPIWGGPSGWGWVDLAASGARVDRLETHLETILDNVRTSVRQRTSAEGWTLHNRLMLILAVQPVRAEPLDGAPFSGRGFPDGCLVGEAVWRTPVAGEFAPGRNAPPHPLEDLEVQRQPVKIREVVAEPLERRGDWLQVAFPEAGAPSYLADVSGVGEMAENQAMLVKWATQPAGWVRLYQAGPVAGTRIRLWSWKYYGSHE